MQRLCDTSCRETLLKAVVSCPCSALTMEGAPTFNGQKLTKRAKRLVGFVLQARPCCLDVPCRLPAACA